MGSELSTMTVCTSKIANLFGIFDTTSAPSLLYFAYIPIALICLTVGIYVFSRNRKDHRNQWFLVMNLLFIVWIANILIQWTAAPALLVELSTRFTGILELPIFLAAFTFLVTLVPNLPGKSWWLSAVWLSYLPVIGLAHTEFTVTTFNLGACEAGVGNIWLWYIYPIEFLVTITTLTLGIWTSRFTPSKQERHAQKMVTVGLTIFMAVFAAAGLVGHLTDLYEINLLGPLGMMVMVIAIAYGFIKYQFGNQKIMAAQLFVVALLFLTATGFFVTEVLTVKIVHTFAFVIALIVGYMLISHIQREVKTLEALDVLNHQLQTQNGQLQDINQQKTEFVSFATHQLRSPLTAMRGYASMLLEGDFGQLAPEARHAVKQIHDASRAMTAIVDDYLNVSRIELKTMKFSFEKAHLSDLVKVVAEELEPVINQSGLKLTVDLPQKEQDIFADKEKIQQVLTNLIDNAIKYTEQGNIKIHVYEHALGSVVCEITDTGMGFTDTTKDKLFQKFSRAGGNVAGIRGTGLGLYVAREIVRAHRGRVWATSPGLGKGSTFAFELPVAS